MYKQNMRRDRRNYRQRPRGGSRIKTFDPSRVIGDMPKYEEVEYTAKHSFSDFAIAAALKENINKRGFSAPTPIQDQAIGEILKGRDVVGMANTGTGKTAAFLIPLINKVLTNDKERILIIAPTRELAVQIETDLIALSNHLGVYSAVCIGGVSINRQIGLLRRRPQFVIGTPGRLLDLNNQRKLDLRQFRSVVLDEVDRMLDMGFIRDIQKIISQLPLNRQSLFFSATIGDEVMKVMRQFTKDPVTISVKSQDAAVNIEQKIIKINGRSKINVLKELLDQRGFEKVLIFGRTKHGADKLAKELSEFGLKVSTIHGNKSQGQRQRSLEMFRDGKVSVLIATDVVARGIDVKNITHVINYELPESYDNYLHRIGRTGRAGKQGTAYTLVG